MNLKIACLIFFIPLFAIGAEQPESLRNLSLAQAIDIAIEKNHDVQLSALAVKSAEAATVAANAAPNPTLTVQTAGINPRLGIGAGNLRDKTIDTTIRIDQVIERGGKRELRRENAAHLEQASQADLKDARRQLRLSVSQAYYDLLAAQENLQTGKLIVALFDNTLDAAQKRKKAGDIAGADVDRIRVDAMRAKSDARQAEADLMKARIALASLMGIRSRIESIQATDHWPDLHSADLTSAVDELIEQRPDIKAARARVDAADSARKLARSLKTRDVSVGAQFEHYPASAANPQGTGKSYGVSVQIPLFVRYYYDGEIRSAEAAWDTARENFEKARDIARTELHRALQDMQAAADRVRRFQDELLLASRKSADAAEYAFKNGAIGVMDVLDARRTYRATELEAVAAQADYAKSLVAWHAALDEDKK